jgi:photosystem II stability/assembly factor-like uncharacterized protein
MKKTSLLTGLFLLASSLIFAQPTAWTSRGIGGGGALFSPSLNPADPNEYYMACDLSDLFHTTDFGQNYTLLPFTQLQGGHNAKVCFTTTPGLLYCIHYANDQAVPVRSTDGGQTWTPLSGNPDNTEETFSIWADYQHPDRVIIAYYGQIWFSNNGGAVFTLVHTALDNGAGCLIGGAFFDGQNIYLGTNDGVLVSADGGATWSTATITGLPTAERIASFAAAKSGNITRFFCLTGGSGDVYVGLPGSDYNGFLKGIYTCDFGVNNWTPKMTGLTVGTDFPMFVRMAQHDINTVYLAGSNSSSVPTVFKSTDAGGHWTNTFQTANNQNINTGWSGAGGDYNWTWGECPFGFDVAANNPNYLIFGDYGFMHKSKDGGLTWQQAYVNTADQHPANQPTPKKQIYHSIGLEQTSCWQVHWINTNTLFSCFSDIRGICSKDAGQSWSFDYTGSGANTFYRIAQSPFTGTVYAAASNIHDMYQSTRLADSPLDNNDAEGKLLFSTDLGSTWQVLHTFGHPVFWIALDPSNPNRAYASVIHYAGGSGIGGIYRCDNLQNGSTSTWTLLAAPPRTEKHPASINVLTDGTVVCSFSGRRNSAGSFTNSSGVFTYNPTSGVWTDVSDPGMHYWTKDVVVVPNDASQNTWYAAVFSGWGGAPNGLGGLYRTTNRGASWTKLTGSQFDRVTSLTFNPLNPKQAFLTTETQGLWFTKDITLATPVFNLVQSYGFRQPERVFFNPYNPTEVWVSSFGHGMSVGSMTVTGTTAAFQEKPFSIYPNPVRDMLHVQTETDGTAFLYDLTGKLVKSFAITSGGQHLELTGIPDGIYMLEYKGWSEKIVKNEK